MADAGGRTDDILVFRNGARIAPLSLYAILREVEGVCRFQLIQQADDRLELRPVAEDRDACFQMARRALETCLTRNGADAEIYLSEAEPQANPISGKFQHIVAFLPAGIRPEESNGKTGCGHDAEPSARSKQSQGGPL